jgi:hypothetical protein
MFVQEFKFLFSSGFEIHTNKVIIILMTGESGCLDKKFKFLTKRIFSNLIAREAN